MATQTKTEQVPTSTTISNLNGIWTLDKRASNGVEESMDVQGLSWFIRKAISLSTIKMRMEHVHDEQEPDRLTIVTFGTHSRTTTTERRVLDFSERENHIVVFGTMRGRSRYVTLAKEDGTAAIGPLNWPLVVDKDPTKVLEDESDLAFLVDGWLAESDGSPARVIESQAYCVEGKWYSHQVWGFQDVGGQRRHVRKMVVWKGDRKTQGLLVHTYLGRVDDP